MTRRRRPLQVVDYFAVALRWLSGCWFALLAGLAFVALALGCWGFQAAPRPKAAITELDAFDVFYQSLQLFALEMPTIEGEIPPSLDLARFLAAFVSFSAVIGLLGKVFDQRLQAMRLWLLGRNHVIVCGLGEKGGELVESWRRNHHFVVVIESDPNHADLPRCHAAGAVVLIGSSADAWQLRKARVSAADVLLAVFRPDDRLNVETAVLAYELCQAPRTGALTCVLQVSDPDLAAVVRKHEMATKASDSFFLHTFNTDDACARSMYREALGGSNGPKGGHILIVGVDRPSRLGETLILRAAKEWYLEAPPGAPKLTIDVLDREATSSAAKFLTRHQSLVAACAIRPRDVALDSAEFLDELAWLDGDLPPGAAFVCLDDEVEAIVAAERLRAVLPAEVPIIVRTIERKAGLGSLIRDRAAERFIAIGLKEPGFGLLASLRPTQELLAQTVHQEYLVHQAGRSGDARVRKPSISTWEDLGEPYRDASRAWARDIDRKLAIVGLRAIYTPDTLIDCHQFTDDEVERLARDEHERWLAEHGILGWSYGTVRDLARKLHPNLVPWDDPQLTESDKEIGRNAIRRLPRILARADYKIVAVERA